ncbi:hypothetical protein HDV05_003651 [Chytridiales sp. JEL 0842]|nr:hypothetical protein HDV05_003651 [Chytridiales sp. JEL 0842]
MSDSNPPPPPSISSLAAPRPSGLVRQQSRVGFGLLNTNSSNGNAPPTPAGGSGSTTPSTVENPSSQDPQLSAATNPPTPISLPTPASPAPPLLTSEPPSQPSTFPTSSVPTSKPSTPPQNAPTSSPPSSSKPSTPPKESEEEELIESGMGDIKPLLPTLNPLATVPVLQGTAGRRRKSIQMDLRDEAAVGKGVGVRTVGSVRDAPRSPNAGTGMGGLGSSAGGGGNGTGVGAGSNIGMAARKSSFHETIVENVQDEEQEEVAEKQMRLIQARILAEKAGLNINALRQSSIAESTSEGLAQQSSGVTGGGSSSGSLLSIPNNGAGGTISRSHSATSTKMIINPLPTIMDFSPKPKSSQKPAKMVIANAKPQTGPNLAVLERARELSRNPNADVKAMVGAYDPYPLFWTSPAEVYEQRKEQGRPLKDDWAKAESSRFCVRGLDSLTGLKVKVLKEGGAELSLGPGKYEPKLVGGHEPDVGRIVFRKTGSRFPKGGLVKSGVGPNIGPGSYNTDPIKIQTGFVPWVQSVQSRLGRAMEPPCKLPWGTDMGVVESVGNAKVSPFTMSGLKTGGSSKGGDKGNGSGQDAGRRESAVNRIAARPSQAAPPPVLNPYSKCFMVGGFGGTNAIPTTNISTAISTGGYARATSVSGPTLS